MSAGTGANPGRDDELPEGFTVPDDLSALFDAPDEERTSPATGAGSDAQPPAGAGDARAAGTSASGTAADDAPGAGGAAGAPAAGDGVDAARSTADAGTDVGAPAEDELAGAAAPASGTRAADDTDADAPVAHASDDVAGTEVPDDLSSLTDPAAAEAPSVTLVLTQVAAAAPLAAACALAGVAVDVVPSPVGALAVLRDPRTGPDGAAAISKLLKTVPVILLERRSGQITATRWAGGQKGDELPAGLVLSDAPPVLEDLLLGGASVADVDGVVTSVGLSRWKAMRLLAQSARGMRG
ncbi:hypothetical protein [Cellulomonas cellasea]|uniref:Uncharacterized protein n=1 Tax=Cellulomonas cellasea TaxID=43670 RepID=A0A7W4YCU5_9CELL|nr:hypothetical protein [Cellulomonas cellasea]MBB2925148.1 hypothetical protein [Cellulomonas cellasea]